MVLLANVFTAGGLHLRMQFTRLAVLRRELGGGAIDFGAEVGAVDEQALLAALHLKDELANRGVWDSVKGGTNATVDRVDTADEVNLDRLEDWTFKPSHQVWQLVAGGTQVNRALNYLIKQGAKRPCITVDRTQWTLICSELHPGADRLEVGLI